MALKVELAEARNEIYRLEGENATQSAVIEMLRIRVGALEAHVRDLERAYQFAVHQNVEDTHKRFIPERIQSIFKALDEPRNLSKPQGPSLKDLVEGEIPKKPEES